MYRINLGLHAALHQENLDSYIGIKLFGVNLSPAENGTSDKHRLSGINFLQCFVQSYCFINLKNKQTNDLFKYGILKDEFSGCVEVSVYFELDISQHFLVGLDIPKFEIEGSIFEEGEIRGHEKPNSHM